MPVRWLRVLLGAIVAEAIPILLLITMVALFGPGEAVADQAYAAELGTWVGPIGGALATLLVAWWIARRNERPVLHGSLVGVFVAAIDLALLVAGGSGFQPLFLWSALGRIVAGVLGGLMAQRGARETMAHDST